MNLLQIKNSISEKLFEYNNSRAVIYYLTHNAAWTEPNKEGKII